MHFQSIDRVSGGAFLINQPPSEIFTSAQFTEEQKMMADSARDFVEQEVRPVSDQLENKKDENLSVELLEKTGKLGLLGLGVPEAYGGYDVSFNSTLFIVEQMSSATEFALTFGVQTSIGIAPILFYGNEEQKKKYLPKLVTGEWKCCYCLTEPEAGSDANSGKTNATWSEAHDSYLINGQKMWITNAGIANIFIVFAKIEDDKDLTAFIIEKDFGGITLGEEECKMGIKGSSTRQVFFNDVQVPKENILGARSKGFKIALNVLNTGRIKLGIGAIGTCKRILNHSINYANERKQFGQTIGSFGAIQHKIGMMATKLYALEAAAYRTGDQIDQKYHELLESGIDISKAKPESVAEFGIECAIIKIFGSETLDFTSDEGVQIYGGMGFSEDAPMARIYRDSRIARIFEGTNEINRMLIVDMLLKKAMKGELDLMTSAQSVQEELTSMPSISPSDEHDILTKEFRTLENLKKAALAVAGAGVQKLMMKLKDEQEIMMWISDMLIHIYIFESMLVKTRMLVENEGEETAALKLDMTKIFMHEAIKVVQSAGSEAIYAFSDSDEQTMLLAALKRYTKVSPENLKAARRRVAEELLNKNGYTL